MKRTEQPVRISSLILDFDGVIADSFGVFVETIEEVLKRVPLTPNEIKDLRGSSTRDVIKKLGVKKWQMPKLVTQGRSSIANKMSTVQAFKGMPEALTQAAEEYKLYILSTNDKEAIISFLGQHGLSRSIEQVYSGTGIFSKAKRLNSLLKHEKLSAAECVYVGDETRDIEAAHSIHMRCIAVKWGYSTPEALQSYGPDAFVSQPSQFMEAVSSLQEI